MSYSKQTTFEERLSAQAEAKRALLAKFKPKPTVTASEPINRDAEREAKRGALRLERLAEKETQARRAERLAAYQSQAITDSL